MQWQPSASVKALHLRAHIYSQIRQFFAKRSVLEVETPLLCQTSVTDRFIESIPALIRHHPHAKESIYYLQTSPEYAMKRLLAAGVGDIYQITKAFRQEQLGRFHNPEFTMLEWYRVGFNHHDLMNEVDALLQLILKTPPAKRFTYAELFHTMLHLNPHDASITELKTCASNHAILIDQPIHDQETWLDVLMTHCIEPNMNPQQVYFIYDFPASLAALSRINPGNPETASRFEVYYQGIELANGFHELQDEHEQRMRFEKNNLERQQHGLTKMQIDEFFLSALQHGLPDCAGVALGIDRLLMLASNCSDLKSVISFDFTRV